MFTQAPVVLGTDGVKKMSKSVGNTIDILGEPELIRKQVMSMVTDTKRILRTDPGRPEVCNVCQLHRFFGDDFEDIWDGERTARTGCVDTKKLLAERIVRHYAPARERYAELMAHPDEVDGILEAGADRLKPKAEATMAEVRDEDGAPMTTGRVVAIRIARVAGAPMASVERVAAHAGGGLEGDRYHKGTGEWSRSPGAGRGLTLISADTLDAANVDNPGLDIAAVDTRRNVEVRGIDLEDLVGREFTVGTAALRRDPARGAVHLPRGPRRPPDHPRAHPQGRDPRRHPRGRRDRGRRPDRPGRGWSRPPRRPRRATDAPASPRTARPRSGRQFRGESPRVG